MPDLAATSRPPSTCNMRSQSPTPSCPNSSKLGPRDLCRLPRQGLWGRGGEVAWRLPEKRQP
eukprot:3726444-Pyramimonas_sp.AAC.1